MMSSVSVLLSLALLGVVKSQGFVPGVANQCFEPVSPGPCRAFIPSFYFNPLTGACDCFIFGGCQANGNKFGRLDECMNTCSVRPQLQTISPTCIRIFGGNNKNFVVTQRPLTPRPVNFATESPLPVVTDFPAVPAPTSAPVRPAAPVTSAPFRPAAPVTSAPFRPAAPVTSAPVRPAAPVVTAAPARPAAPVVTAAPARITSSNRQPSSGSSSGSSTVTIQQGNLIITKHQDFEGTTSVVGSVFSQSGVTGQTTITIGQPVFISRRTSKNNQDDDDK